MPVPKGRRLICQAKKQQCALLTEYVGRIAYGEMLQRQEEKHVQVVEKRSEDTLFLLEHEAVITLGKNRGRENLLVSEFFLQQKGIALFPTNRGGDVTYHGPGQLIAYPIIALKKSEQDVQKYVYNLEEIMIRTAKSLSVCARRIDKIRGVFVGNSKLGAVGVRISKWVTMHGLAFNVAPISDSFNLIVPCGLHGFGLTSLSQECRRTINIEEILDVFVQHAGAVLDRQIIWGTNRLL